jgi:hypothetical protein
MPMQLPNDAVPKGWKETRPCYYEKVFFSPSRNFTGTEDEFYEAGHSYYYWETNKGWRGVLFKWPL